MNDVTELFKWIKVFLIVLTLGVIFSNLGLGAIPASERAALIALYKATDGDHWDRNRGWKTPPLSKDGFSIRGTENQWAGVRILRRHVTELYLGDNHLTGAVPSGIKNLRFLSRLYLERNRLTSLPPEIGNLDNCRILFLDSNLLSALPPEIGKLSRLEILSVNSNGLTSLPPEIASLSRLNSLGLRYNHLTTLPPEIRYLSQLNVLDLGSNDLTSLPPEIGELSGLSDLRLDHNELSAIPEEMGNLSNLKSLNLGYNQFIVFPKPIGDLTNLTFLDIGNNNIANLSPEIGNLTSLTELKLNSNSFTGLPPEIINLDNLTSLDLSNNQLTLIPREIMILGNLGNLILSRNRISEIPREIENLRNLSTLEMSETHLDHIPSQVFNLRRLKNLILSGNRISEISTDIDKLTQLRILDLSHNQLTVMPQSLRRGLRTLNLSYNQISGLIPPDVLYDPGREVLRLDHNSLWGQIPSVENIFCRNYRLLDLSFNQLTEEIPESFFVHIGFARVNLSSERDMASPGINENIEDREDIEGENRTNESAMVATLNLSNNQLSGKLNRGFFSFKNLKRLYISNNEFTGGLPIELGAGSIEYLNVSLNRLSGPIPEDVFRRDYREFDVSSNNFSGEIPGTIVDRLNAYRGYLDLGYNVFYSTDWAVIGYLYKKNPEWYKTQTALPNDITALGTSPTSVRISWTPVLYTTDSGGYRVYRSDSSGGPWILAGNTDDKKVSFFDVKGLSPDKMYYFTLQTFTARHGKNKNDLATEFSEIISGRTFLK